MRPAKSPARCADVTYGIVKAMRTPDNREALKREALSLHAAVRLPRFNALTLQRFNTSTL
jgi:hypothetical protein